MVIQNRYPFTSSEQSVDNLNLIFFLIESEMHTDRRQHFNIERNHMKQLQNERESW